MSATVPREQLLASVHQLQPGDVLLVQVKGGPLSARVGHELRQRIRELIPGIPVLVYGEDLDISAWRPVDPSLSGPDLQEQP